MKKLLILAALLALSGCGWINRQVGYITGYSLVCVEETRVQYIQFPTGATVLVDQSGKPVPCK